MGRERGRIRKHATQKRDHVGPGEEGAVGDGEKRAGSGRPRGKAVAKGRNSAERRREGKQRDRDTLAKGAVWELAGTGKHRRKPRRRRGETKEGEGLESPEERSSPQKVGGRAVQSRRASRGRRSRRGESARPAGGEREDGPAAGGKGSHPGSVGTPAIQNGGGAWQENPRGSQGDENERWRRGKPGWGLGKGSGQPKQRQSGSGRGGRPGSTQKGREEDHPEREVAGDEGAKEGRW